jgi:tRNA(fMet)-specific endonuclease VapC
VARLILDSTVLVAAERRGDQLASLLTDGDDVAIAALTAAELLVGVELAGAGQRETRRAFVEDVLSVLPVETYDLDVARAHAALLAHARRSGRPRGGHDLIIAATAVARRRNVVSDDVAGFEELPGVGLVPVPAAARPTRAVGPGRRGGRRQRG